MAPPGDTGGTWYDDEAAAAAAAATAAATEAGRCFRAALAHLEGSRAGLHLGVALRRLQESAGPGDSRAAALALAEVVAATQVARRAALQQSLPLLQAARRAARDLVVQRCRQVAAGGGLAAFRAAAREAFGGALTPVLQARLEGAYEALS